MKAFLGAAALAVLCVSPVTSVSAQDMPTAERNDLNWYSIHFIKFKPGKRARAHEIIDDYYIPADKAAGIGGGTIDLHLNTGEWDGVVAFPMSGGPADMTWDTSPNDVKWMAAMAEIAGGMDKAQAILAEWDSLVEDEEIHVGHIDKD
ncbi:hypothetical protein [Sphingomicrobium aestuariivivum]|uniref:hypothetical protein n=1 Tax=Sphingomicrobium aestuariivivum TaxID=1582356 RepID=UPI001FD65481|nr:hypothetical protein [Sphingomicrobium aestuariivivum]MCJ8191488.1 hypothetical protein [Sphingomicrobium aestuariivivum]